MAKRYFDLTGRVAVVTGASTGLGVQMAKALAAEGAIVALLARRENLVKENAAAIAEEFGIVCMTRGSDDCKKMIEEDPFLRKLSPYITIVRTPRSYRNVSSTGIRQKLKKIIKTEKELERMVPEEILPQLCGPGGSLPTIQTLRRDNQ